MDADTALTQELAKMVGITAALSIALNVAVKANPRAAELRECLGGVRQVARADLGKFHGQPGFDGIEISIRDFDRLLRGANDPAERDDEPPPEPVAGIGRMVGIISALEVALKLAVETNPQAAKLRERLDDVREAAIARVIGEDVLDNVFDGIDYVMDNLDEMLPAAGSR